MSEVDQAKFSCDGCGKSYKWKPEFAGRKVKCKCGFVMTAPAAPPEPPADDGPDLDALYSLADDGKQAAKAGAVDAAIRCPSCRSQIEPGSSVCAQCGFNLKTGKKGAPAAASAPAGARAAAAIAAPAKPGGAKSAFQAFGAPRRRDETPEVRDFKAVDLYLPIGLLAVGVPLMTLRFMKFYPTLTPLPQALMYTGLWLALNFGLIAMISVFLVRFVEMAFGDPVQAALKIAGIVLAPVAVANIISFLIHDLWGMVGYSIAFAFFFILYHYMFEFDMSEKWIIVVVTCGICMFVAPIIFEVIIGTSGGSLASKGARNEDAEIDYMMDMGRPTKMREWMDGASGRLVGDLTREATEELYKSVSDAGAAEIWIVNDGPQAAEVYIKMPKDSKKRASVLTTVNAWNTKYKRGPAVDEGGKWLTLRFLPYMRPPPPY